MKPKEIHNHAKGLNDKELSVFTATLSRYERVAHIRWMVVEIDRELKRRGAR